MKNRMPEIYGKYQFDSRFRGVATQIAKLIHGMSEQDAKDALRMARQLNNWDHLAQSPYIALRAGLEERDRVMRGVQ